MLVAAITHVRYKSKGGYSIVVRKDFYLFIWFPLDVAKQPKVFVFIGFSVFPYHTIGHPRLLKYLPNPPISAHSVGYLVNYCVPVYHLASQFNTETMLEFSLIREFIANESTFQSLQANLSQINMINCQLDSNKLKGVYRLKVLPCHTINPIKWKWLTINCLLNGTMKPQYNTIVATISGSRLFRRYHP